MKKRLLPIFVFMLTFTFGSAQYNITFELNTETIAGNIDPGGLYIAGGSGFGFPGDNELTDPDGDGIYTTTLQRDAGFSSHYTFLNGNCADWGCKENIAGLPCADPSNFNDRFLPELTGDVTIQACFGTCDDDGSCTIVTDSIDITFELNTSTITDIDPGGIFIAGGGNFGNPGDNPMIDPDGDGIYTFTSRRPMGFVSYYTFLNGNCSDWSCKENLEGLSCGDPDAFNDRFLPASATMEDVTIQACFGNCANDGSCTPTSINGLEINETLFKLQPTLVNGDFTNLIFGTEAVSEAKEISVFNGTGQLLHSSNSQNLNIYQINTANFATGLYFINVRTKNTILTKKFVVSK